MLNRILILIATFAFCTGASAQVPPLTLQPAGTVLSMTGAAELELPNDEAVATFFYEVQNADLAKAQALINQRIADATSALKRADPKAHVDTSGYSSYPVYSGGSQRTIIGWRVRQSVTLRTANLTALPSTVAAVQPLLALGNIDFRLSKSARDSADAQLIKLATANLNERLASAAAALGGARSQLRLEEINYGVREVPRPLPMRQAMVASEPTPRPPSFEPGQSIERLTISGKARLLP